MVFRFIQAKLIHMHRYILITNKMTILQRKPPIFQNRCFNRALIWLIKFQSFKQGILKRENLRSKEISTFYLWIMPLKNLIPAFLLSICPLTSLLVWNFQNFNCLESSPVTTNWLRPSETIALTLDPGWAGWSGLDSKLPLKIKEKMSLFKDY